MIKKAVALTLREYWRAVHPDSGFRPRPCDYPGMICDYPVCDSEPKKDRCSGSCWDYPQKINGKYPIRRCK